MDEEKQNKKISGEEMKGSRGLETPEHLDEKREHRGDAGRHREARNKHEWVKKKYYCQISKPLEDIVGSGFLLGRPAQRQVIRRYLPEVGGAKVGGLGDKVAAKVTAQQPGDRVNAAVEQRHPRSKKMEASHRSTKTALQDKGEREIDERGHSQRTSLAPMQARIGKENDDTAKNEREEGSGMHPVGHANDYRVAGSGAGSHLAALFSGLL
jgi:hypothetical protein